jgi:hypothetical protein
MPLFRKSPTKDLPDDLSAAVERCTSSREPTPGVTLGRGTTSSVNVAGTSLRSVLIMEIARRYPEGTEAPACLVREPANAHDPNAVRVFVDGYLVGYLKAEDAKRWQTCLLECERRGVVLCACATFYGPSRWGVELSVRREPPRADPETLAAERGADDALRKAVDAITAARLDGVAVHWDLKVSKHGHEFRLVPGKPYGHGTRPPLRGWQDRVFTLDELEDLLIGAEQAHAAAGGYEFDG